MKSESPNQLEKVAALKLAFDRAFSAPPIEKTQDVETVLAIRISSVPYAVSLSEISGLLAGKPISPVPGPLPEMLGFAGIRGAIVPVYSLAMLLGYGKEASASHFILCQNFALAIEKFEGIFQAAHSDIVSNEVVKTGSVSRAIVNIPSILAAIKARIENHGQGGKKE